MNTLLRNWPRRVLVILVITAVLCLLMAQLASTEWAGTVRLTVAATTAEAETGTRPSGSIIYLMSAVKVLVMTGVPLLLAMGIRKLISRWGAFS